MFSINEFVTTLEKTVDTYDIGHSFSLLKNVI